MRIVDNILYTFKLKKFNIKCDNEEEWIKIQKYLFKKGYCWEVFDKQIKESFWGFPAILKNYRTDDKFGSKILINEDYNYFVRKNYYKYATVTGFIRKEKLKKMRL